MHTRIRALNAVIVLIVLVAGAYAQNKFEGYSVAVDADAGGECAVGYLPSANEGNAVDIFYAGTQQRVPATSLTACDGAGLRQGNKAFINEQGRWCFNGPEPFYDI